MRLGVNIDHVATIRQARRVDIPDPVEAAAVAEGAGADGITIHLREDRRHIQDRDVHLLRRTVTTKLNLELADVEEIVGIALAVGPEDCCVVPERRQEVTTEGGLDVVAGGFRLRRTVARLRDGGIRVSLFVAPDALQIAASADAGAEYVELHTGRYAEARNESERAAALRSLLNGVELARARGLRVNAGHGLNYANVGPVAAMPEIEELNIGHAIVARAVLVGLDRAVREMKALILEAVKR